MEIFGNPLFVLVLLYLLLKRYKVRGSLVYNLRSTQIRCWVPHLYWEHTRHIAEDWIQIIAMGPWMVMKGIIWATIKAIAQVQTSWTIRRLAQLERPKEGQVKKINLVHQQITQNNIGQKHLLKSKVPSWIKVAPSDLCRLEFKARKPARKNRWFVATANAWRTFRFCENFTNKN